MSRLLVAKDSPTSASELCASNRREACDISPGFIILEVLTNLLQMEETVDIALLP